MKALMLFCVQCDEPFIYSVKEQLRHERHGFDAPRRCQSCRQHKVRMEETDSGRKSRRRPKSQRRSHEDEELSFY